MRDGRWRRRLVRENAYRDVWLVITTGMALWAVLLTFSTANETHKSLCALRTDIERRVESGRTFLNSHPNGAFGFSRAQIVKGIADQQRTITALRNLNCE